GIRPPPEELRRPGVTLMLLWEEYGAAHPQGFAYSWFCDRYRDWVGKQGRRPQGPGAKPRVN
ncbi:MAG: hypothetical protein WBM97_08820, partial [Sedimenticolaceae bacterium]